MHKLKLQQFDKKSFDIKIISGNDHIRFNQISCKLSSSMTLSKSIENQSEYKSRHKVTGKSKLQESLNVFEGTKSMKKEIEKYKEEIANLKSDLEKYEQEVRSLKTIKEIKSDEEEINKKKMRIKKLKEELKKVLKENEELNESLNKTNNELNKQKEEVASLNEKLKQKEKYNETLEEEGSDMEKRYEHEFNRKVELEKENKNMKEKLQNLLKENEDLKKFQESNKEDENFEHQLKDLENEIAILNNCLKTKDERYNILINTAKELKDENKQLKDENEQLKNESIAPKVSENENDKKLILDLRKSIDNSNKHIEALKVAESELNKYNKLICEENKSLLEDKIYWLGMFQKFFKLFGKEEENIKEFYENVMNSNCPSCKTKLCKKEEDKDAIEQKRIGYKSIDWSEKSLEALKNQYKVESETQDKTKSDRLKEYDEINFKLKRVGNLSNTHLSYECDSSSEMSNEEQSIQDSNDLSENSQTTHKDKKEYSNKESESSQKISSTEDTNSNEIIYKNHLETISLLKEILRNLKDSKDVNTSEGIKKVNEAMKNFQKKLINKFQIIIEEQGRRLENIFKLKEVTQSTHNNQKASLNEAVYKKKYEDLFEIIIKIREILESRNKKERKLFCKEIHGHINKLKKLTNRNVVRLVSDLNLCVEFVNETDKINDIVDSVLEESHI